METNKRRLQRDLQHILDGDLDQYLEGDSLTSMGWTAMIWSLSQSKRL
jgi:hypothetical protein